MNLPDRPHFLPSFIAACVCLASSAIAEKPPNVVVILSDDVGWGDLGCYGATRIKTPNLDGLAREGMRFTDAHASAAVCTPSRYSLLTGQYSWRMRAVGLDKGVANGDSPLLIPVTATTLPKIMKSAGYRTGVVGKWHLGFGNAKPDYNKDLTPGPLEVGFDEFFGFPATNDRVPTVYVRDHRVIGLDPDDPIEYTYDADAAAKEGMVKWAAGRSRIGWMSGGKAALWNDKTIADTFTKEAVAFIERNQEQPFFLYFAPHGVHPPTITGTRFHGTSGIGDRADMMQELDWSVGELLKTLGRLGLAENTLVIFSSDNGATPTDEDGHLPNGMWRGKKSQLWEGGHREPFIARWPGHIAPGVSDELVCLVDLSATAAALVGKELPAGAAPDSFNLLPILLGQKNPHPRDHLVLMSGKGDLAIRQGKWKYIPDLADADGWSSWKKKDAGSAAKPGLYDLSKDPGETENLHGEHPEVSARLAKLLQTSRAVKSTRPQ